MSAPSPIPVPPADLIFIGSGDYTAIGEEFALIFRDTAGLGPTDRVLDTGCGIGRMAVPLTRVLEPPGRYDGFDIVDLGIRWCQEEITSRYPHFRFHHVDLFNPAYNPGGTIDPERYRFPFPDQHFDFVIATSVFTHLRPAAMAHYAAEITRVLVDGGRAVLTYCVQNAEALQLTEAGRSHLDFRYRRRGYWTINARLPEDCVAYAEDRVRQVWAANGCDATIHWGQWCGRERGLTYQDVVVIRKGSGARPAYPGGTPWWTARRWVLRSPLAPLLTYWWRGQVTGSVARARAAGGRLGSRGR
jgi:SAM-dependent methyltransferase